MKLSEASKKLEDVILHETDLVVDRVIITGEEVSLVINGTLYNTDDYKKLKRYWQDIISKGLTFEAVDNLMRNQKEYFCTRPMWNGFHYYDKDNVYCILFNDGHIEKNMLDHVWNKDESDWMIVTATEEALKLINEN